MAKLVDDRTVTAVRDKIIEIAQQKELISYRDLALAVGIDPNHEFFAANVGRVLDEVNREEHRNGRPLLSAVVVGVDRNGPGPGFYEGARELKRFKGNDKDMFWLDELRDVYEYWRKPAK